MKKGILVIILVMAGLVLAACGPAAPQPLEMTIRMSEFAFEPNRIEAKVGQQVTLNLVNDGALEHEIMFGRNMMMGDAGQPNGYETDMFMMANMQPTVTFGEGMEEGMDMGEGEMGMTSNAEHGGDMVTMPEHHPGRLMLIPMIILAFFSLIAGFIELPESMGHVQWFSKLLDPVLPAVNTAHGRIPESFFQLVAGTISLSGIYLAYRFYLKQPYLTSSFNESRISKFLYKGWGFDRVYDLLFVNPLVWFAVRNKNDFIDLFTSALARAAFYGNYLLSITQNGRIRWYVMAFVIGIVFMLTIFINL